MRTVICKQAPRIGRLFAVTLDHVELQIYSRASWPAINRASNARMRFASTAIGRPDSQPLKQVGLWVPAVRDKCTQVAGCSPGAALLAELLRSFKPA